MRMGEKRGMPQDFEDLSRISGLSENEAKRRIQQEGYNELPASKPRSIWRMAFEVAREPMFLLLISCGLIYLMTGEYEEAAMLRDEIRQLETVLGASDA